MSTKPPMVQVSIIVLTALVPTDRLRLCDLIEEVFRLAPDAADNRAAANQVVQVACNQSRALLGVYTADVANTLYLKLLRLATDQHCSYLFTSVLVGFQHEQD